MSYAKLLDDPCGGQLVNPVYPGADGGYLNRYEVDFQLSSLYDNAQTNSALVFAPGLISNTNNNVTSVTGNNSLMALGLSSEAANVITDSYLSGFYARLPGDTQPGYNSLIAFSEAVRPVSACLQVMYTGTELNRQGIVAMGRCNAGSVLSASAGTLRNSGIRQLCDTVIRTPETMLEYKWSPCSGDMLYGDPSVISGLREAERKNAIILSVSGVPLSDIRIRMVVVYEWQPRPGYGIINAQTNRSRSTNTIDQILNYLDAAGRWWCGGGAQFFYNLAKVSRVISRPGRERIEL